MQHDSIKLLLDSLERETKKRLTPSELARALNVSEQVITNWSKRGISLEGALAAQFAFHRDANYILGKISHPIMYPMASPPPLVMEPIKAYTVNTPWPFTKTTVAQWNALEQSTRDIVENLVQKLIAA